MERKKGKISILIIAVMTISLIGCTTVSDPVSDSKPAWVDDISEAEEKGIEVSTGTAVSADVYEAMENAMKEARDGLREWTMSSVDGILALYGEKAGNRVNTALVDAFREYAAGYVPSWISGAEETGRWTDPETGKVHILMSLDTDRLVNEIRLFTENLIEKTVEHRDARTHASINLMAAIDGWSENLK